MSNDSELQNSVAEAVASPSMDRQAATRAVVLAEEPKVSTDKSEAEKRNLLEAEYMRMWDENERLKQEVASRSEQIKQQELAMDQISSLTALATEGLPECEEKAKVANELARAMKFLQL